MTAAEVSQLPTPPPRRKPAKKASVAAREAEADDGYVTIEHRGVTLRVPVGGKMPIAAVDAFREGDNYQGTRIMLGQDQWKALSDAGMTLEELDELGKKLDDVGGK